MRKLLIVILALLILSVPCFALVNTYEINYDISMDKTIQKIKMTFPEKQENTVVMVFKNDANILSATDEKGALFYETKAGENVTVLIRLNMSQELTVIIENKDLVLSSYDHYQFIDDFNNDEYIKRLEVLATLPKGYSIYKNNYLPGSAEIITDGERISVLWTEFNVNPSSRIYSIKFAGTNETPWWLLLIIPIVILLVAIAWFYKYHKRKTLHEFKKGFAEDEIKIVDILKKEKTMYQNKIEKELHFSRAKMTRITEKLKKKGLIEKKKYGRTNKLVWKG
jgi:uncharacterized membrane protein